MKIIKLKANNEYDIGTLPEAGGNGPVVNGTARGPVSQYLGPLVETSETSQAAQGSDAEQKGN